MRFTTNLAAILYFASGIGFLWNAVSPSAFAFNFQQRTQDSANSIAFFVVMLQAFNIPAKQEENNNDPN